MLSRAPVSTSVKAFLPNHTTSTSPRTSSAVRAAAVFADSPMPLTAIAPRTTSSPTAASTAGTEMNDFR